MALTTSDNDIVVIMQPPNDTYSLVQEITFHPHWKSALDYVQGYAQGDDPGEVTIRPLLPLLP